MQQEACGYLKRFMFDNVERTELGKGYPIISDHEVAYIGKMAGIFALAPIAEPAGNTGADLAQVFSAKRDPPAFPVDKPYCNT